MTFWPLTNSDFPTDQTFHQFHDLYTELDLHQIMSGFHGAFATGVASQQGTLTLPVPSPIVGLANAPIGETEFLELAMSLLDFSPRMPLGTFSILLLETVLHMSARLHASERTQLVKTTFREFLDDILITNSMHIIVRWTGT